MSDRIRLEGIQIYAHHGVHAAERELGQRFVIDADLFLDCTAAGLTDELERALDYSAVHERIRTMAGAQSFQLIEALAHHLCLGLLDEFNVEKVAITVRKPHPPLRDFQGEVSVRLERDRRWLENLGSGE